MFRKVCQLYLDSQLNRLSIFCRGCSQHRLLSNALDFRTHLLTHRKTFSSTVSNIHSDSDTFSSAEYVGELIGNVEIEPATKKLVEGLMCQDRASLARAITLVESSNAAKRHQAQLLLTHVLKHGREEDEKSCNDLKTFRIGLSGPPGAGKSTFIETFGQQLTAIGHRVAVLAVDPSSSTTGGSLLADKTRMPMLAVDPRAFIRPSPSRGTLGGVARNTSEAVLLCEGAGFDIIIVETVGVGQSEFVVADMVDLFCLLIPPGGGDELQGMKRGIVEVSDLVVVNKSDGNLEAAARLMQAEFISAMKFMRPRSSVWKPKVMRISSKTGTGIKDLWETMVEFRRLTTEAGLLKKKRQNQLQVWMWNQIRDRILQEFQQQPKVREKLPELERMVREGLITPGLAADILLENFFKKTS